MTNYLAAASILGVLSLAVIGLNHWNYRSQLTNRELEHEDRENEREGAIW
jgi:hypothetical protein